MLEGTSLHTRVALAVDAVSAGTDQFAIPTDNGNRILQRLEKNGVVEFALDEHVLHVLTTATVLAAIRSHFESI